MTVQRLLLRDRNNVRTDSSLAGRDTVTPRARDRPASRTLSQDATVKYVGADLGPMQAQLLMMSNTLVDVITGRIQKVPATRFYDCYPLVVVTNVLIKLFLKIFFLLRNVLVLIVYKKNKKNFDCVYVPRANISNGSGGSSDSICSEAAERLAASCGHFARSPIAAPLPSDLHVPLHLSYCRLARPICIGFSW